MMRRLESNGFSGPDVRYKNWCRRVIMTSPTQQLLKALGGIDHEDRECDDSVTFPPFSMCGTDRCR